jgi:phenylalanine-4-hydroxylase
MPVAIEEGSATAGAKNRYRSARRNADYTIDQDWQSYSAAEHDRWDRLFRRSQAVLQNRACDEFLSALTMLKLSDAGIPQRWAAANHRLARGAGDRPGAR